MPRQPRRRSGCPVSLSLDIFGDRWSLLIVRDMMVRGYTTFKQFHQAGEGIATNILADRLQVLQQCGLVASERMESDARQTSYRLTEKGIDLAPVLLELLIWGIKHQEAGVSCALVADMSANRDQVLAEVRRRWETRDPNPLLPHAPAGPIVKPVRRGRAVPKDGQSGKQKLQEGLSR